MQAFYSVFSAVLNPNTSEKLSLGLLLSDGHQSIFDFSPDKLNMIRPVISRDQYFFIKNYFRSVNNVIAKIDKSISELSVLESKNAIINEPYFDYLSTYNQNVITVSRPVRIDIDVNKENFSKLFTKYIAEEKEMVSKKKHSVEKVRKKLIPKVDKYFSVEKEIFPPENSEALFPVKVDLIGKNHQIVISQFLDLERNLYYVKNDFFDLELIPNIFPGSQNFLVSAEPDKKLFSIQHNIWKEIRQHKFFKYLDASEAEETIREYAVSHQVQPYEEE